MKCSNLDFTFGIHAPHSGPQSLLGILNGHQWVVHPDPFGNKEQTGFTGGHIVRTYGSHRPNGIDAIQLEPGGDYRKVSARIRIASELADTVAEFAKHYLDAAVSTSGAH